MHQTLPLAKQMLEDEGGFVPYGAVLTSDGDVVAVGVDIREPGLNAFDVVEILEDNMIDMAKTGAYRAAAMFYAVKVTLPGTEDLTDAVAVTLAHQSGPALMVFHPFNRVGSGINYGSMFACENDNRLFRRLH